MVKTPGIFFLFFICFLSSCKPLPPFTSKKDLMGKWVCRTIDIITPNKNIASFAIYKYGYANFSLDADNTYMYSINITSDVILEKEVLGNTYAKTILKRGYEEFRKGYYSADDSLIVLYDVNKIKIKEDWYYFKERTLVTVSTDNENKLWKIFWEKEI